MAALDSEDFAVREKASRDLEGVREAIRGRLQRTMEKATSPEAQRRLRHLLRPRPPLSSAEHVRRLRAVMALERIGSPEARELLKMLAGGENSDPLTAAARGALVRLTSRGNP